jgi:molybdopterin-guanine dinucleotide biosynthesis protein B
LWTDCAQIGGSRERRKVLRVSPIVSIVGKSKSGKTTLIEKLVPELKARGYRVATVKHAHNSMSFDEPGKDSWRHAQAGSDCVAIVSPDKIVVITPHTGDLALEQITSLLGGDYDIVIAEGFKRGNAPKIEVHRKEVGPPLSSPPNLMAIVTNEPLETKERQFSTGDITGVADLLEEGFLKREPGYG